MIAESLLNDYGAKQLKFAKGTIIFNEGEIPVYYHQILLGEVKMNNYNEEGKEFIQNIFVAGQSFGEPPLFIDTPYPANAIALTDVVLIVLKKAEFNDLLLKTPEVSLSVIQSLSRRLLYKSVMAPEISSQDPAKKILAFLSFQKKSRSMPKEAFSYKVTQTRQQLADLTGLRVETVIRVIKQLEKSGYLKIYNRKIFY